MTVGVIFLAILIFSDQHDSKLALQQALRFCAQQ